MNNDPEGNKENSNERNPFEINHNASLAEKRGEAVVENGEKEPSSDTPEKSPEEIEKENKPEELKLDTETLPEKIESAEDKNSKNLVVGSKVSWNSADGTTTNSGTIISFEKDGVGNIVANVKPDSDPDVESVKLFVDFLSLVNDGTPAGPEQTEEEFNKAKELAREVLGVKAVQWYVKQNKRVRLGAVTALAVTVGVFTGGLAVGGVMVGNRIRRGVASFADAGATNIGLQRVKSLSIEELNKAEEQAIKDLENSGIPATEQAKKYEEIKKEYDKKRIRRGLVKGAITVAAGAGAGGLAGLLEDGPQVDSSGKSLETTDAPEAPLVDPEPDVQEEPQESSETSQAEELKPQESVAATGKVAEGVFDKPEELAHIKVEGDVDSNWRVIEKAFEQNEKFRNFAEQGQKDIVVNYFVNKAMGNPKLYDFTPDERFGIRVEPGQEVDLSKLLSDKDEIEKVLDNAAGKTPKQLEAVAEQREKIEAWLKKYPDRPLTKDAVTEILSQKVDSPKVATPTPSEMNYDDAETKEEVVSGKADTSKDENLAGLRSMSGDSVDALNKVSKPSLGEEVDFLPAVEETFKNEFDKIYAENGWLKKTPGMNTPEGRFMASQNWQDLLKYSKGDLQGSGLSPQLIKIIESSPKHLKFLEAVKMLNQETADQGVLVALQPNVKVPEAMKKIVTAIMKNESTQSA